MPSSLCSDSSFIQRQGPASCCPTKLPSGQGEELCSRYSTSSSCSSSDSFFTALATIPLLEISTQKYPCKILFAAANTVFQVSPSSGLLLVQTDRHSPSSLPERTSHQERAQYLWDSAVIPNITLMGKHVRYIA